MTNPLRSATWYDILRCPLRVRRVVPEAFPLAVQSATQVAMAGFSATGFKAAAVSSVAMMVGGGPPPKKATSVTVGFDRPFGFLAVDRATGLVLFAGWIVQPVQPEIEYLSL
jgi:serine protease inhibitor